MPDVSRKATYVPVLDESRQFGMPASATKRHSKYRVTNNLPGNINFCPLVSKTPYLIEMVGKQLKQRTAGFTPKGIILPVSAVVVANLDRYKSALEAFSRPMRDRTSYNPDVPETPATGNDAIYFRYFDATVQASFLFNALERTVENDLPAEIYFLIGFDRARLAPNALADWPAHSLENFIRLVHQNGGKLSANKRKSYFAWMRDDEVERFERVVGESFENVRPRNRS